MWLYFMFLSNTASIIVWTETSSGSEHVKQEDSASGEQVFTLFIVSQVQR